MFQLLGHNHSIEQIPQGIALEICGPGIENTVMTVWQEDTSTYRALYALNGRFLIGGFDDERRGGIP